MVIQTHLNPYKEGANLASCREIAPDLLIIEVDSPQKNNFFLTFPDHSQPQALLKKSYRVAQTSIQPSRQARRAKQKQKQKKQRQYSLETILVSDFPGLGKCPFGAIK